MTSKRVVLGRRQHSMVPFRWSGAEPEGMSEVEVAEELGALWEGDELVTYDLPGLVELFQYYTDDAYLPDND